MITSIPKLWAIVPAAGIGARFSDGHPKQFHQLRGKTMAEHTLLLSFHIGDDNTRMVN